MVSMVRSIARIVRSMASRRAAATVARSRWIDAYGRQKVQMEATHMRLWRVFIPHFVARVHARQHVVVVRRDQALTLLDVGVLAVPILVSPQPIRAEDLAAVVRVVAVLRAQHRQGGLPVVAP